MNKRQIQMLTRFDERNQHAHKAQDGTMVRWVVIPYVDGERQPRCSTVFLLRYRAVEFIRQREAEIGTGPEANEYAFQIEQYEGQD